MRQIPHQYKEVVASGIALLGKLGAGLRPDRESLVRGTTIALQSPHDSTFVGSIEFSYYCVTPHPPPQWLAEPKPWKFGNGVGGHRGQCRVMECVTALISSV